MAKLLKLRRGSTTQHASFTGAEGEVTIDTTKDTAVVHDGSTQGGTPLAKENMSNVSSTNIVDRITNSALAGVKVQPNFGTQDIETTGNIDLSDSTGSGNNRIKLGTGDDLQIYHDGNFSRIVDGGTGDLVVHSNTIAFRDSGDSENLARFHENGSCELYYDNAKKFETTSSGITVTGHINLPDQATGVGKIKLGAGNDLQLYHDGLNSNIVNNTGELRLGADHFEIRNAAQNSTRLASTSSGAIQLYHNNSLKLNTNSNGVRFVGMLAGIDNDEVALGTGNDLKIYHDGSHSFIQNSTGDLVVPTQELRVTNAADNENLAKFEQNGGVELYYDNSKKLETTSSGISTDGLININGTGDKIFIADNGKLCFGGLPDLKIYHDGSNSYIQEVGAGDLFIRNGNDDAIRCRTDAAVELYYDNVKKLETDTNGVKFNDDFYVLDSNKGYFGTGNDLSIYHNGTNSYIDNSTGILWIRNQASIYARSDEILLQTYSDATNENYLVATRGGDVKLYYDNSHKVSTASTGFTIQGNSDLRLNNGSWTGENGGKLQHNSNILYISGGSAGHTFRTNGGTNVASLDTSGNFTATGNVTAYSDARLKTDIHTINDALSICGKLRGVSYKWIADGKPSIGVIAQEVEEVIPEIVLTKDDLDPATGKSTEVKSVDYGKIVGVLINAINELKAEVDELKGGK